jgi:DNA-binding CsgD family transcriptional regulator
LEALGLTDDAAALYRIMLDHPDFGLAKLAEATGLSDDGVRTALDNLADLMLVRASREDPGRMRAVSLEVGLADMIRRQEAELATRQALVAATRAAVVRLVADRAEEFTAAPIHAEQLVGLDAIQDRLEHMGRQAKTECMGVHPGAAQRPEDLAAGRPLDAEAMARGVFFRTLYQSAVRNDPPTVEHAHWLMDHGGEVRTAPIVPQRLVIVDRTQALVPLDPVDTRKGALHVTEPGIVNALCDLFDQAWATAVPLGATREPDPVSGLSDTERELLRLLATGMTDEAAGHRIGVSLRTVRRMMASVMERLGATSRFEAGIKAAHYGWL